MRFRHDFLLLLTVVCLLPVAAIPEPAPISVEALFKNPSFDQPRLSPDGTRVALAISLGDDQIVAVRPLSGGDAQPIVRVSHDEIRLKWLRWGNDETVLISGTMRDARSVGVRGRASRLFSVPATGGKLTWLGRRWPEHGQGAYRVAYQDRIAHNLPGEKGHVLVEYQNPIKDVGLSIQRMNVRTGALRGYQPRRDDIWHWGIDKAAVVRVGVGYTHDNHYFVIARPDADSDWEEIIKFPLWQDGGPTFAGFTPDPNVLYVHAPHEGRQALFEWDIRINELGKLVFAHDRVDAEGVVYGEDESVIGVRYIDDTPKIRFLDRETGRLFLSLNRAIRKSHGSQVQIELVSESQDHRFRIFEVSGPTQPPIFYIHDQEAKGLAVLLVSRPDVDTQHLSAPRAISYEARDGRTIEGYLTLPRGGGEEKLPLIVMPHGGPWARDWMRWDPEVQLFASRGYAVFQPNFRGSEGFGDDLLHAGYREWGYAIQDDITDGTNWLVEEGIADPHRIGIYGGSFGAFASLMGLVKTPDLYSAGAGYAGCYDIEDMVNDDQWYQWWDDDWHEKMIGADPERLRTASPRRRANEIRAPVLLAHGQDDQRLNANQSRDMHEALKKAGKQVEYMEFENEIHGFLFERNKIAFYSRLIEFFDEHLAPRAQPEKLGGN